MGVMEVLGLTSTIVDAKVRGLGDSAPKLAMRFFTASSRALCAFVDLRMDMGVAAVEALGLAATGVRAVCGQQTAYDLIMFRMLITKRLTMNIIPF